ncbi:hypothetical protein ACFL5K_00265 [Gemmatimonadota bacterium]
MTDVQCKACHSGSETSQKRSDNLLPSKETCEECHDVKETSACKDCHVDTDNPAGLEQIQAQNLDN